MEQIYVLSILLEVKLSYWGFIILKSFHILKYMGFCSSSEADGGL